MTLKRAVSVAAATILLDQMIKILVKTNMFLGESSFKDWNCGVSQLQLIFVEDPPMPLWLIIFRFLAIGGIIYYIIWSVRHKKPHKGFITCLSMIVAGIISNMIDVMFYGVLFSASGNTADAVAKFLPETGGYSSFMNGYVVDMLHISPLPKVYNIADLAIFLGIALIVIFGKRYFPKFSSSSKK